MRKIASVSSLMHAHVLTCAAVALSFIFKASGASFTYNDLTVEYTNASLVWMGEEPALVYSNATVQGTLVLPGKAQVRMLLVGGGGAGGTSTGTTGNSNGIGGGGGAGGFLETNDVTLARQCRLVVMVRHRYSSMPVRRFLLKRSAAAAAA